jgi:hypothetical protein
VQTLLQRHCAQQQQQHLMSLQQLLSVQVQQQQPLQELAATQVIRTATSLEDENFANKKQKATPRWTPAQPQLKV